MIIWPIRIDSRLYPGHEASCGRSISRVGLQGAGVTSIYRIVILFYYITYNIILSYHIMLSHHIILSYHIIISGSSSYKAK